MSSLNVGEVRDAPEDLLATRQKPLRLVSTGLGGTFPPGYPVGVVRAIRSITGQPFLEIDAEPSAALNRIREVLLIAPQSADDAAIADESPAEATDQEPLTTDNAIAAEETS